MDRLQAMQVFVSVVDSGGFTRTGARQGSCRLIHAANGGLLTPARVPAMVVARSGLRVTTSMRDQSRVVRDQRRRFRSRACWYYLDTNFLAHDNSKAPSLSTLGGAAGGVLCQSVSIRPQRGDSRGRLRTSEFVNLSILAV